MSSHDRPGADEDAEPSKRLRTEESERDPAGAADVEVPVAVTVDDNEDDDDKDDNDDIEEGCGEAEDEVPAGIAKERASDAAGESCAICMEADDLLAVHGCEHCKPDAWRICSMDYSPLILHVAEGMGRIHDPTCDQLTKATISVQLGMIKESLSSMNIAVYVPESSTMTFLLPANDVVPEDAAGPDDAATEAQPNGEKLKHEAFCAVSIPMAADRIAGSIFHFTNKTWDELINHSEQGDDSEAEVLGPGQAIKFLFDLLKVPGATLFTELEPAILHDVSDSVMASLARMVDTRGST
jgi:hypothetical protein